MTRCHFFAVLLLAAAQLIAPHTAAAAESYGNCTGFITILPAVISTPGTWCFNQDLSTAITTGNAITINTNDVILDCNDFRLDGQAAGLGTSAYGIRATSRLNATVRNCNIRGFYYGVFISNGGGHSVLDNRFDGNTSSGLRVDGPRSVVRRNRVYNTGGSTVNAAAFGIVAYNNVDILDNTVSDVKARAGGNGAAYGIYTSSNLIGDINGNRTYKIHRDGTGFAYAIYNTLSNHVSVRNNDLLGDGSTNSFGVRCATAGGSARDNMIIGFTTGLSLCGNDGGNVIAP